MSLEPRVRKKLGNGNKGKTNMQACNQCIVYAKGFPCLSPDKHFQTLVSSVRIKEMPLTSSELDRITHCI